MERTFYCEPYSIDDGTTEYFCGPFNLCPGETIVVDGCGKCSGDESLALTTSTTGFLTASSDDGCGGTSLCAKIAYAVPPNDMCQGYNIRQYCRPGTTECSGNVSYTVLPSVTSYVEYFEELGCSEELSDTSGGPTTGYACSAVDTTGRYAKVTCEGSTAQSEWTSIIYPNPQCTGAYFEKILGSGACDCHALDKQGYLDYSLRVNCAGVAPTCAADNNSKGGDHLSTLYIVLIAVLGAVILGSILLFFAYFTGWCGKKGPDPAAPQTTVSTPSTTNPAHT